MKRARILMLVAAFIGAQAVRAAPVREMSGNELRDALTSKQLKDPGRVLRQVQLREGGEALDIRAFRSGTIFYWILVKRPDGEVVSVVVDAQTGNVIDPSSDAALAINATARGGAPDKVGASAGPNGRAAASPGAAASGAGHGNDNGNGNGNGNGVGNAGGHGGNASAHGGARGGRGENN